MTARSAVSKRPLKPTDAHRPACPSLKLHRGRVFSFLFLAAINGACRTARAEPGKQDANNTNLLMEHKQKMDDEKTHIQERCGCGS